MEKSDFVIIGGVACGPKTGAVLARRLPDAKITLFQKDKYLSYGACGLPYYASGDINRFEELTKTSYGIARTPEFFKDTKGFEVRTESEVTAINRDSKTVTAKNLSTGEIYEHGYGKLVIATGANPVTPSFPVADSPRIKPFTRPDEAISFRKLAQTGQIRKAVIIGGGMIGCELAEAAGGLWGIEVTLIEKENQLLPYVLDPEMAKIAERELVRNDIRVMTGSIVERIELTPEGNPIVKLKSGDLLETDYVFLCLGVKPETTLAKACGLELGATGGIKVDNYLQTSDPDIYAGGDCIESVNQFTGQPLYIPMGSLANRHGKTIAENLAGNKTKFPGVLGAFMVKIFELNIGAVGLSGIAAAKANLKANCIWGSYADKPDYYPEFKTFTAKMIYDDKQKLLGFQAVGEGDIVRRVDVFSAFLQSRGTLDDLLNLEHGYAPPYAESLDPLYHLASAAKAQLNGTSFVNPGALDMAGDNAIWLDIRETVEYNDKKWPYESKFTSLNIPLGELRDKINLLDRNKKIMLICKRGSRSYQASMILKAAGFTDIHIVGGGIMALE